MSHLQSESNTFNQGMIINSSFKIREFLSKLLYHWPLFILFLGISFSVAIIYVKFTNPLFTISAKILIKDPTNKQSEGAALQELNLTQSTKSVDTEMGLLTSIPNIEEVVNDLQLWITYNLETSHFTHRDIYNTTPVQFRLIKVGGKLESEDFDIIIKDENTFFIKKGDVIKTFLFKDKHENNFGTWMLDTTSYTKKYIGKTIRIHLQNTKDVIKYYQDRIDVENFVKTNPTINLTMDDEVPERGTMILNDLLRVYTASSIEDKRKTTHNTLQFVDLRLKSLTDELNSVEGDYEGYKSSRGIMDIASQTAKIQADAQAVNTDRDGNIKKLAFLENVEKRLDSDQANEAPSTVGLESPELAKSISDLIKLRSDRNTLLVTLPEANPKITNLEQQIKDAHKTVMDIISNYKAQLREQNNRTQTRVTGVESSMKNIPGQERDLANIKRMQGIKENLYIYLLQKKEEISLDYASTIADSRIVEQAHYGPQKSPIPSHAYAIALLAGILIPAGLIYGRTAIKNRILSKNEIVFETGLPVLGELIYEESAEQIRVLSKNHYIGEQFRDLRTKVNYLQDKDGKGKITLLTSSISGEGKSFVASNLAVALAVSGKKTIIIEMDLRRPKLADIFEVQKNRPGLSDFLHGDAEKSQIIEKLSITDNLYIINCNAIPPNPSELLESAALAPFLESLREEYDHILLDSPPVHLVTDATILAPLCDLTLYMIRQGYTPKTEFEFIRDLYVTKKLPRMNIVFNGVQNDKYGYGYNYSNSYYLKSPVKAKQRMKKFFGRF